MEENGMAYYLEDLNRVHDLSMEQLGEWKEQYPYSQMVHFLMAKKHQLEGFLDDMSVFHKASFYAVDRVFLKERMEGAVFSQEGVDSLQSSVDSPESEAERSQETDSNLQSSVDNLESEVEISQEGWSEDSTGSPQFAVGSEQAVDSPELEVGSPETVVSHQSPVISQDAVGSMQSAVGSVKSEEEVSKVEDLSPFAKWVNGFDEQNIDNKKKKKKKSKKSKLEKKIKESIIKNEEIISEPLANILAEQGHTEKAKAMYEKLSLIFPEKSSFFALQIEKLINSK